MAGRYHNHSMDRNLLFSSLSNSVTFGSTGPDSNFAESFDKRHDRRQEVSQSRRHREGEKRFDSRSGHTAEMSNFPSKLFECRAQIVLYQAMLGCGILKVYGPNSKNFYCFFLEIHCMGSFPLNEGSHVCVNMRLMNTGSKIPYMAASVWRQGENVSDDVMDILANHPAHQEDIEKYVKFAEDIAFGLNDTGDQVHEFHTPDRHGSKKRPQSVEMHRRSFSPKRSRVDDLNPIVPSQTSVPPKPSFAASNISEEYPSHGARAVVDKYLTSRTGQLSLVNTNNKKTEHVLFHVNQVWMLHVYGHSPYLETYSAIDLEKDLEVGKTVNVNVRRITGCDYKLQATAVWTSKDPPKDYKTVDLLTDLNLRLTDYIFTQTKDPKLLTNPLAGASDCVVSAKVQEYFSLEMGFLQLDSGDRGVVMFHLDQVWTDGSNKVLYKTVQDQILLTYLPIGSSVLVNLRRIPASNHSSLRYQATLVMRKQLEELSSQEIPKEYIEKYRPHNQRLNLVNELDAQHDGLKKILNLDKSAKWLNSSFTPVHAVLNGLPDNWIAEVVAAVSEEFGIIKISHQSRELIGHGAFTLYAMFHIEDVFDAHGIPAIQSPNISMNTMLNCHVDLTARPICIQSEPEKILKMQARLRDENRDYSAIPLLQAVVVCVKMLPASTINFTAIPKPTRLRDHPGSFGQKLTEFYLNASLGEKLNIKLQKFLAIPNKLNLPYERVMMKLGKNREKNILNEIEKVDVNKSSKFMYGEVPKTLPKLDRNKFQHILPKILTNQKVKPLYLHRNRFKSDCGIVEIELEISVDFSYTKIKTLAFFELSRYKFFTSPDSFATDLANIMPIYSKDDFYIHAQLAYPDSEIPYVALAIWNEDLRRDIGADRPMDFKHDQWYAEYCQHNVKEIISISKKDDGNKLGEVYESSSSLLPIPDNIGKVSKDVKTFDTSKVIMDDGKIKGFMFNTTGVIERVLSNHIAILRVKKTESSKQEYRVLCSSDDIFILDIDKENQKKVEDFKTWNKVRFSSIQQLWFKTARNQKVSLFDVLKPGQQVRLNIVPLLSNPPNGADVYYCSAGVLVTKTFQPLPVPVNCVRSSKDFTDEFKIYFMKIVRNLNNRAELEGDIGKKIPPEKIPVSFKGGKKGKFSLHEDYIKQEKVKPALPNPVRAKKQAPKPIVWEKIINDFHGVVIRIIDKNYGIGAAYISHGSDTTECTPFQFLFDTFDVFVDGKECSELGKKLSDVMGVGDFIKFNAAMVESKSPDGPRDIKYMTTAMVVAKTAEEIKSKHIPETAARISSLEQVAQTKLENFKVVVGVMNSTKINDAEKMILERLRSGQIAAEFSSKACPVEPSFDVVVPEEESDDEITVIGDEGENESENVSDKIMTELKPNELRKLIMCYMEAVSKLPEKKSSRKINVREIVKNTKIEKSDSFFENFVLYLGQQCRFAIKGVKIGHVFVTQAQVNMIKTRGVMSREDIDISDDKDEKIEEKVSSLFSAQDLRKVLLNFMKLIQGSITLNQLCTEAGISAEEADKLLREITVACSSAQREVGRAKGMKFQNIFINSTWVEKITGYNYKSKH